MVIKVFGETVKVHKDTTLYDVSRLYEDRFEKPILLAKVNGRYRELSEKVQEDSEIEFIDLYDRFANRVYINGLIMLLNYAAQLTFNKINISVLHSIDKGIYLESDRVLKADDLYRLKMSMRNLVGREIPIERVNIERTKAINYFETIGNTSKAKLLHYTTNTYVTLYRLEYSYEYLYSKMPNNTRVLKDFDLHYLNDHGFVLQFPTPYMKEIEPYKEHDQFEAIFREYRGWKKALSLDNVSDLNSKVGNRTIDDTIRIDETIQSYRLLKLAQKVFENQDKIKIVLISGPSSSGKTTTCHKFSMYLKGFGLSPKKISMDDYFKDNVDAPVKEDGSKDFERPDSLDIDLFDKQIGELLSGKEVTVPTFNFILGMKEFKNKLKLENNEILVIEGMHALNPELLKNIPNENKLKIYISPLIELNIDKLTRVQTSDNRLLRRLVRDYVTRGHSAEYSFELWKNVREGEEKYVFPCQDYADYTFNSALCYEIGVLKVYAEPLLYAIKEDSPYYDEAKRLIDLLSFFMPIANDAVPQDSILREFIGKSCFYE